MLLLQSSSAGFCKPEDLKASHIMLTWKNGWSEMHCGLKGKSVKILNALSSQQRPILASHEEMVSQRTLTSKLK